MLLLTMPATFKPGDSTEVKINGQLKNVKWEGDFLTILPNDHRRIKEIVPSGTTSNPTQTFVCENAGTHVPTDRPSAEQTSGGISTQTSGYTVSPVAVLLTMPPGVAMPLLNDANKTVMIAVHEDANGMMKYGASIPCFASLISETIHRVEVVCVLIQLGPTQDATFEFYINAHSVDGTGAKMLKWLCTQEQLQVSFYVRSETPVRQIGFTNQMRAQFQTVLDRCENLSAWSMHQFNDAKRAFQQKHPPHELATHFSAPEKDEGASPAEHKQPVLDDTCADWCGSEKARLVTNGVARNRVPRPFIERLRIALSKQMVVGYRIAFPVFDEAGGAIHMIGLATMANDHRLHSVPEVEPDASAEIVVVILGFERYAKFLKRAEAMIEIYPEQPYAPEFVIS